MVARRLRSKAARCRVTVCCGDRRAAEDLRRLAEGRVADQVLTVMSRIEATMAPRRRSAPGTGLSPGPRRSPSRLPPRSFARGVDQREQPAPRASLSGSLAPAPN